MAQPSEISTHTALVLAFLTEIGIPWRLEPGARGFLSKSRIEAGVLCIDPECTSQDLLHEAGHLALLPGEFRHLCSADLSRIQRAMFEGVKRWNPDDPLMRCMLQCSDPEATAWAWAAGQHIGLPNEAIVANEDYNNTGESMRAALSHRAYLGINGLQAAGMTTLRANPYRPHIPVYPQLTSWLAPTYDATPDEIARVNAAMVKTGVLA